MGAIFDLRGWSATGQKGREGWQRERREMKERLGD